MNEKTLRFFKPKRPLRELFLLLGLEGNSRLSQHDVAKRAGQEDGVGHGFAEKATDQAALEAEDGVADQASGDPALIENDGYAADDQDEDGRQARLGHHAGSRRRPDGRVVAGGRARQSV